MTSRLMGSVALAISLLGASNGEGAPNQCPTGAEAVALLSGVTVNGWDTVTKEQLFRGWPKLVEQSVTPPWPAHLTFMEESQAGTVECELSFVVRKDGGIRSFSLVLSGTRVSLQQLGSELIAALKFEPTEEERLDYRRRRSVILRRMSQGSGVGVDLDISGTEQLSYLTLQGYNFGGVRP